MRNDLARRRDPLEEFLAQTAPYRPWRSASVDSFHAFVLGFKVSLELFIAARSDLDDICVWLDFGVEDVLDVGHRAYESQLAYTCRMCPTHPSTGL